MKLTVKKREKALGEIRRTGGIPAIIYSKGQTADLITIDSTELDAHLRGLQVGHLPTTIFVLHDGKKERRVLIKDIQRNIITYRVSHIDFEELIEDSPVSLNVPITLVGIQECVGTKLGGTLRQVIRRVKVKCLPRHIPKEFILDVRDLAVKQKRRLSDLSLPAGVKPLVNMGEVVVVIAKGKG